MRNRFLASFAAGCVTMLAGCASKVVSHGNGGAGGAAGATSTEAGAAGGGTRDAGSEASDAGSDTTAAGGGGGATADGGGGAAGTPGTGSFCAGWQPPSEVVRDDHSCVDFDDVTPEAAGWTFFTDSGDNPTLTEIAASPPHALQFSPVPETTTVLRKTISGFDTIAKVVLEFAFKPERPALNPWSGPMHVACVELSNRVCLSYIYEGSVFFQTEPYSGYFVHWFLDEKNGVGYSHCRLMNAIGPESGRWSTVRLELNSSGGAGQPNDGSTLFVNGQSIATCANGALSTAASVEIGGIATGNGAFQVAYDNVRVTVFR